MGAVLRPFWVVSLWVSAGVLGISGWALADPSTDGNVLDRRVSDSLRGFTRGLSGEPYSQSGELSREERNRIRMEQRAEQEAMKRAERERQAQERNLRAQRAEEERRLVRERREAEKQARMKAEAEERQRVSEERRLEKERQEAEKQARKKAEAEERQRVAEERRLAKERQEAEAQARMKVEAEARQRAEEERMRQKAIRQAQERQQQIERQRFLEAQARIAAAENARQFAQVRSWYHWGLLAYGVLAFFLPRVSTYRDYCEYAFSEKTFGVLSVAPISSFFFAVAAYLYGSGLYNEGWGYFYAIAMTSILGLRAAFFLPSMVHLLWQYLHFLIVPHPAERMVLQIARSRSDPSAHDLDQLARALYDLERDGLPKAWISDNRRRRIDAVRRLIESETEAVDTTVESVRKMALLRDLEKRP